MVGYVVVCVVVYSSCLSLFNLKKILHVQTHTACQAREVMLPQVNFENRCSEMASGSYLTCKASFSLIVNIKGISW